MQSPAADSDPGRGSRLAWALAASLALHGALLAMVGPWSLPEPPPEPDPLRMVPLPPAEKRPDTPPADPARSAPRDRRAQGKDTTERARTTPDKGAAKPAPAEKEPRQTASEAEEGADNNSEGADKGSATPSAPSTDRPAKPESTTEDDPAAGEKSRDESQESTASGSPKEDYALYPSDGAAASWARDSQSARAKGDQADEAQTATQASQRAAYLQSWLAKVQRLGHYPDEARERGITGSVGLRVRIRPDGTLAEVAVADSSGHRVLDKAALATIRQGAPYSALPPVLKAENPRGLTIEPALRYTREGELVSR